MSCFLWLSNSPRPLYYLISQSFDNECTKLDIYVLISKILWKCYELIMPQVIRVQSYRYTLNGYYLISILHGSDICGWLYIYLPLLLFLSFCFYSLISFAFFMIPITCYIQMSRLVWDIQNSFFFNSWNWTFVHDVYMQ